MPTEISVGIVQFPLAPSLRAAGSPHLMLSTQIRLGEVSASVGTPGRSNSRSLAAGASPGTPKNRACPWTLGHKHSSSLYSNILTKSLEMENTMYRLPISLRVLSPASWIPLRIFVTKKTYKSKLITGCILNTVLDSMGSKRLVRAPSVKLVVYT